MINISSYFKKNYIKCTKLLKAEVKINTKGCVLHNLHYNAFLPLLIIMRMVMMTEVIMVPPV